MYILKNNKKSKQPPPTKKKKNKTFHQTPTKPTKEQHKCTSRYLLPEDECAWKKENFYTSLHLACYMTE